MPDIQRSPGPVHPAWPVTTSSLRVTQTSDALREQTSLNEGEFLVAAADRTDGKGGALSWQSARLPGLRPTLPGTWTPCPDLPTRSSSLMLRGPHTEPGLTARWPPYLDSL